jgi:hypothetical protein
MTFGMLMIRDLQYSIWPGQREIEPCVLHHRLIAVLCQRLARPVNARLKRDTRLTEMTTQDNHVRLH